jgi:8-oxo-dGTP pyrophosphatase MutT (NUDIX family)
MLESELLHRISLADSHVSRTTLRKRASVALILRSDVTGSVELLFILRAHNPKDRWSGQVGFPGGRQQSSDLGSDFATAVRETREEIGLDLNDRAAFEYLMQLHDSAIVPVTTGDQPLAICPFVFRQVCAVTPPTRLALKEVADVRWVALSFFQQPNRASQSWHRVGLPGQLRIPQWLVSYPAVLLPNSLEPLSCDGDPALFSSAASSYAHTAVVVANHNDPPRCVLWGLTLGLTAAFLTRLGDSTLTYFLNTAQNMRARSAFLSLVQLRLNLSLWAVRAEHWFTSDTLFSPESASASAMPGRRSPSVRTSTTAQKAKL